MSDKTAKIKSEFITGAMVQNEGDRVIRVRNILSYLAHESWLTNWGHGCSQGSILNQAAGI